MTVLVFHRLEIEGLDEELAVERWTGSARLHAPFELHVLTQKVVTDPIPLGAEAILHLATDEGYALGGVVERAEVTPEGTLVVMVPPVARLAHCRNHRVVLEIDGLTLAKDVIAEHSLSVESRCGATPAPRPQRVQAFETDLGYAARLLAEEGMTWFCDQDGQGATSIVFVDGPSGHAPIVGDAVVPYRPESGLLGAEAIEELRLSEQWTVDRFQVRDYCYETPSVDLTTEVGEGPHGAYRFVGPGRYKDGGAGQALAQRLLEVEQREATLLEATSSCHRLWPGRTFELGDAPRDDLGGEWLVIEATYEGQTSNIEAPRVAVRFKAIPANRPWRPTVEPAPTMGGVQTATITGPAGEEIHTDDQGRVRAKLRYDVQKPADDKASAWCRVLHPPTNGGFMLPRTGWEALVGFSRDSGDEPYVLGRLDNGSAPTAESLPGKQICSNFGTPTTPGRGAPNMIRMTDTAGSEDMGLTASRDWNEQTAKNKSTKIDGTLTHTIGANHTITVAGGRGLKVDGAKTTTIAVDREITAATGVLIDAGMDTVSVGGTRSFEVGGDQAYKIDGTLSRIVGGARAIVPIVSNNRHVDSASTVGIGGAWIETGATGNLSVAGASAVSCSATSVNCVKYSLEALALSETCAARTETSATIGIEAGSLTMVLAATKISAGTVVIKGTSVTVTAGGGVLSVSPGSVKFTGAFNAGGHVRSKGDAHHG